jgi:hypothetical protein
VLLDRRTIARSSRSMIGRCTHLISKNLELFIAAWLEKQLKYGYQVESKSCSLIVCTICGPVFAACLWLLYCFRANRRYPNGQSYSAALLSQGSMQREYQVIGGRTRLYFDVSRESLASCHFSLTNGIMARKSLRRILLYTTYSQSDNALSFLMWEVQRP